MIKLSINKQLDIAILNDRIRLEWPIIEIASSGSFGLNISVPDDTSSETINEILTSLAYLNTLIVEASKTSIVADGIDTTNITSSGLTIFNANVWVHGVLSNEINITDGLLEFGSVDPGIFLIEIIKPGTWETGYIKIEVVETS